jgi:hypothetical protein
MAAEGHPMGREIKIVLKTPATNTYKNFTKLFSPNAVPHTGGVSCALGTRARSGIGSTCRK